VVSLGQLRVSLKREDRATCPAWQELERAKAAEAAVAPVSPAPALRGVGSSSSGGGSSNNNSALSTPANRGSRAGSTAALSSASFSHPTKRTRLTDSQTGHLVAPACMVEEALWQQVPKIAPQQRTAASRGRPPLQPRAGRQLPRGDHRAPLVIPMLPKQAAPLPASENVCPTAGAGSGSPPSSCSSGWLGHFLGGWR
jgi:hypothetical protein